jgi:hypothetical protein
MKNKYIIFLLIIYISPLTYAEINKINSLWLEAGAGLALKTFQNHSTGISLGLGTCVRINRNIFSLRSVINVERHIDGPLPAEQINDISILWGQQISGDKYQNILPLIGIGIISNRKRGGFLDTGTMDNKFDELNLKAVGISLGCRFFSFSKVSCFGFYLLSNINNKNSYFSVHMCLGFGKMF